MTACWSQSLLSASMSSGNHTWVIGLGGKCPDPQSHFTGPEAASFYTTYFQHLQYLQMSPKSQSDPRVVIMRTPSS